MDHLTRCTEFHCHVATLLSYWYYAMYQYKCKTHYVLLYEKLYCCFARNFQGRQGLIKNSAKFKFPQLSSAIMSHLELLRHSLQRCQSLYYLNYILYVFILPPHSASCPSVSLVSAPVGGRKNTTSASCYGWNHRGSKWSLCQWLREKHHHHKLLPVTTTASTRCKGQGARCKGQDQHQCKSERDAATTCNSNHHHHWTAQDEHRHWWSAWCSNHCNLRKGTL